MTEQSPELQVTSTEYLDRSGTLFESTPCFNLEILLAPLTDDRASLNQITEFFENPLFFDEKSTDKLTEVTEFFVKYPVKTAMWETEVHEQALIFRIETKTELDIEVAVLIYGLKDEMQSELEDFIESENVHQVTLQETGQKLYVESKTDLHAEFENIEGTGVKVSGYEIRMTGEILEASFGGKWYSLESATDKNSDIYQLLSKVTEAMKNGQTAVTVTSHGMSPATNKKFEIKTNSVEYTINVFDIKAGKAYNYILVDKTLDDVKEILAKIGIELNLENPDLTFGAVNGFNKQVFEKDNFINSAETIQTDLSTIDFEQTPNLPTSFESVTYPFIIVDLPDFQTVIEFENDMISPEFLQEEPTVKAEVLEINEPEINSLERIEDEPDKPPKLDTGIILIFNTDSENSEVIFGQNGQEKQTAWNMYELEDEETVEEPKGLVAERGQTLPAQAGLQVGLTGFDQIGQQVGIIEQEIADQIVYAFDSVPFNCEVKPTSTSKVDVGFAPAVSIEETKGLEPVSKAYQHNIEQKLVEQVFLLTDNVDLEIEVVVKPLSTLGVDDGFVTILDQVRGESEVIRGDVVFSEQPNVENYYYSHEITAFFTGTNLVKDVQKKQIAEQVVLLQEESGTANFKEEEQLHYLSATVESSFKYPLWMDTPTAYVIRKQIESETGKKVSELQEVNGKIVGITI